MAIMSPSHGHSCSLIRKSRRNWKHANLDVSGATPISKCLFEAVEPPVVDTTVTALQTKGSQVEPLLHPILVLKHAGFSDQLDQLEEEEEEDADPS